MKIITQQKQKNHSIYRVVTLDDAGHIKDEKRFDCKIEYIKKDGEMKAILYDKDGHIREEPDKYLNDYLRGCSEASRRQAATALNSLHVWCDMTMTDHKNLSMQDIRSYQDFCRGISIEGHLGGPVTFRCAKTVNAYYAWIKKYIEFNQWNLTAFSSRVKRRIDTVIQDIPVSVSVSSDPNRLREDPMDYTDPKMHLTPKESKRLLEIIESSGNNTALVMTKLMLFVGLRIGAVIGLTLEDIETYVDDNGEEKHQIILRNRVSDHRDQHCKGLYHPVRVEEYEAPTYDSYRKWEIPLADFLYEDIMTYIQETRDPQRVPAAVLKRIRKDAAADNVHPNQNNNNNEYVFVGRSGRRMTTWTYNNWLKKYFTMLSIPVDHQKKSTNCSHRLRHTFAMYFAHYSENKKTRNELKTLLTHNSILSSEAYYTPTKEERAQLQVDCQNEILKMLNDTTTNNG